MILENGPLKSRVPVIASFLVVYNIVRNAIFKVMMSTSSHNHADIIHIKSHIASYEALLVLQLLYQYIKSIMSFMHVCMVPYPDNPMFPVSKGSSASSLVFKFYSKYVVTSKVNYSLLL